MEAVAIESRKIQEMLARRGVHAYDAVPGTPYDPALHERVGAAPVDGQPSSQVAVQQEPGYASQQPEFVLRRPKVIVTE